MSDSLSQAVETALGADAPAMEGVETPVGRQKPKDKLPADKSHRKHVDHHLWGTYIFLVIVAVIELFSASIQLVSDGNIFQPIIGHGKFLLIGLGIMLLAQHVHYRWIYGLIPVYVIFSLGLITAVRTSGESINGAVRAVTIMGTDILPAEFVKLAAALGIAWIFSRTQLHDKRDISWGGFWAIMLFVGICAGLLFSQGLSNTIIVVCISFSMMLIAGISWKKFILAAVIWGSLGAVGYYIKTEMKSNKPLTERQIRANALNHVEMGEQTGSDRGGVWKGRVNNHFRPNKHLEPITPDNQQEQLSYLAQAHGGFSGAGIGRSRENSRLPLAYSDYIFAIIIEECGLWFGIIVLCAYMWILGRSARLTMVFKHTMPGIMTMGCACVIVFQALYHMAIVTGVIPVSGQPLPLISKGGISVIVTSAAFGVMLSCSRHATRYNDSSQEQEIESEILPESARGINPALTQNK